MLIGYARTSTVEQVAGFEDQKRELEKAGVDRVYANRSRPLPRPVRSLIS